MKKVYIYIIFKGLHYLRCRIKDIEIRIATDFEEN